MYGNLPRSLRHIISNAEYYGPSLFLLATDVVTVYVFQEPSLLSSLQESGLTDVVLHALLVKEVFILSAEINVLTCMFVMFRCRPPEKCWHPYQMYLVPFVLTTED